MCRAAEPIPATAGPAHCSPSVDYPVTVPGGRSTARPKSLHAGLDCRQMLGCLVSRRDAWLLASPSGHVHVLARACSPSMLHADVSGGVLWLTPPGNSGSLVLGAECSGFPAAPLAQGVTTFRHGGGREGQRERQQHLPWLSRRGDFPTDAGATGQNPRWDCRPNGLEPTHVGSVDGMANGASCEHRAFRTGTEHGEGGQEKKKRSQLADPPPPRP